MNFREKETQMFQFVFKVGKVVASEEVTIQDQDGEDVTLQSFALQGRFVSGVELVTVSPDAKYQGAETNVLLSVKNRNLEQKFRNPITGKLEIEVLEPRFFVGECLDIKARLNYYLDEKTGEVRPSLRATDVMLTDATKEQTQKVNIKTFANVAEAEKAGLRPIESIVSNPINDDSAESYFAQLVAFSGKTQTQLEELKTSDAVAYKAAVDGFISSLPKVAKTAAIAELA